MQRLTRRTILAATPITLALGGQLAAARPARAAKKYGPGGRKLATKSQRNRGGCENCTTCQTLHDDLPLVSLLFKSFVCIPWVRGNQ